MILGLRTSMSMINDGLLCKITIQKFSRFQNSKFQMSISISISIMYDNNNTGLSWLCYSMI